MNTTPSIAEQFLDFAPIVFVFALIAVTLVIIAKMFPKGAERVSAFMDRLDGVDENYEARMEQIRKDANRRNNLDRYI
jgi:hypothetical protein